MSYVAPSGYALLINNVPQSITYQYTGGGWYSYDYTLELRPVANYQADTLGNFSGIQLGKSVSWDIGLGGLHNGRSAGRIMFKEKDLTNAPSSRARLYYAQPSSYGESSVFKDGASNQTLRQVWVPQGMVDIVDDTAGYWFKFYTQSQIEWSPGNPAILHGNPWKTIQVQFTGGNLLTVTETEGATVRVSALTVSGDSNNYVWTLKEGTASTKLRTTSNTSTKTSGATFREVVSEVHTGDSTASATLVSKAKYRYDDFAWNEELTKLIADPDTAQLTTSYYYYATVPTSGSDANRGNYRLVRSVTDPTGNWTGYLRYDDWNQRGQVKYEYHPDLDSPAAPANNTTTLDATAGRVVYSEYGADWTGRFTRPILRQEWVNNVRTAQTTWTNGDNVGSGWPREFSSVNSHRDGTNLNYQTDYTEHYRGDAGNEDPYRPYMSKGANLTQTSFSGMGLTGGQYRELVVHGSTSASGADSVSSWSSQTFAPIYLLPNKSTMEVTVRDVAGSPIHTETYVYTGSSNFSSISYEDFTYDFAGRLTQRVASNGATIDTHYTAGRMDYTVDATGIRTEFTYDELGRVAISIKKGTTVSGYTLPGDLTSAYTYDGANHVTQTVTSGGSLSLTATAAFDLAGRQYQQVQYSGSANALTTGFAYSSGGKIVTATLPGGATKVTETYLDGQMKQVSGTAVISEGYTYWIDGAGKRACQSVFGGNFSAWTNSYKDWLGRSSEEWKPGWNGNAVARLWYYNSLGQLWKYSQPGLANTFYEYDTLGRQTAQGLDINANDALDRASDDRITESTWAINVYDAGTTWWAETRNYTYSTSGNSTQTLTGVTWDRLNLGSGNLAEKWVNDIFGNRTHSVTSVDRTNKKVTTTTYPPASNIAAVQIAYNGLTADVTDTTGVDMKYGYDALGRQNTSVDPRTGTTTTAYVSGTSQVSTVTDPANVPQATYTYDAAGRVATVTDALGKVARYEYNSRNQKTHEFGDTTYPVEYVYDSQGRQTQMNTFATSTATFTGGTWPASPNNAQATTWAFHAATGFLASKTDAASHAVSYTYTQAGQVNTCTNTRNLVTTNTYSPTTGELTGVTYSDGTTALAYAYNRLGRMSGANDDAGSHTFTYNLAGTLELQREDFTGSFGGQRLTYIYDTTTSGAIGRPTAFYLGTGANPTGEQTTNYAYQADGRLGSVASGGYTYAYAYTASSHLISSTTCWGYTDTRAYDPYHDWIDSRTTAVSGTTKAGFAYAQDSMGRVTDVTKTGEIYNPYGNGTQGLKTSYAYDDRSELTGEQTKVGTTATILPGRDNGTTSTPGFTYDYMGNRKTTVHNGNTATYTANSLNQYTNRTVPGYFDVGGSSTGATVTVNNNGSPPTDTAARSGQYFFDGYPLSNGTAAVYTSLNVYDGTTTAALPAFLAPSNFTNVYDADGNLLDDGRWTYFYNAKNQLISAQTSSTALTAGVPKAAWNYSYDYLGRRILKTYYLWISGNWVFQSQERYIYNGWNLVAVFDPNLALLRSYFWGLDISGTMQGAGGVGGLLMTQDGGNTYLPMYDAMGNVHGMIKASDGSLAAAYEYDAFGNTLRESGPYAASNPFRYSTKFTDIETGLVYYGHRYYSPSLGRFLNRDPIEEAGGLNLYGFCGNNGVNRYDLLGQDPQDSYLSLGAGSLSAYYSWHQTAGNEWSVSIQPSIAGRDGFTTDHMRVGDGDPTYAGGTNSPAGSANGATVVTTNGRTVVTTTKVRGDFTVIPDNAPNNVGDLSLLGISTPQSVAATVNVGHGTSGNGPVFLGNMMDFSSSLNDAPSLVGYVGCGMDYYNASTPASQRVPGIPIVGGDRVDLTNSSNILTLVANGIPSGVYSNPQWRLIDHIDMVNVLDNVPRIREHLSAAYPTSPTILSIQSTSAGMGALENLGRQDSFNNNPVQVGKSYVYDPASGSWRPWP